MISIILPFYNEQDVLPVLLQRIRDAMTNVPHPYELIFVNDDSTDESVKTIAQQGKKFEHEIVIVNMSRRFGVEESFMAGLEVAQGDAVILMYTDLQDPPEIIPEMILKWTQGADIVHTLRKSRNGDNPLRKIAVHFAYKWISKTADVKIPYDAGEFKLISKFAVNHVRNFKEKDMYLRGLIPWIGFKQDYIYYDLHPRPIGKSKVPLFGVKALNVLISGFFSFSNTPSLLILFLTIIVFCLTLIFTVLTFTNPSNSLVLGLISLGCFIGTLIMIALTIIGIYVGKIYKNTTGRPNFIIKDVIR